MYRIWLAYDNYEELSRSRGSVTRIYKAEILVFDVGGF